MLSTAATDKEVLPDNLEQALLQTSLLSQKVLDPFEYLKVSREDKMTFFLLKWVFSAIQQKADSDDKLLMGQNFVLKSDMMEQFALNDEIMRTFNYSSKKALQKAVTKARCVKEGCLTWPEFLDFFFFKEQAPLDEPNAFMEEPWWL